MNRTRPTEKSIFFVGYDFYQRPIYHDGLSNHVMDLYSIKPPEVPDIDSAEEEKKKEPPPSERNAVLTHFSAFLSPEASSFSALGSSTLCVFSVNSDFSNEFCMLDTATAYREWKRGPPMSVSRCDPRTVVLDGKLYVLEGLQYGLADHQPFMEVFDPDVGTWEPLLPNPPFMGFSRHEMVTASLAHKKQILVGLVHRDPYDADTYNGFYNSSYTISFYVYNVMDRSWAEFVLPRKIIGGVSGPIFLKNVIAVGDILYWVFAAVRGSPIFVFRAYDLLMDEWFEGCLNVTEEVFEKGEMFYGEDDARILIHLCDQKFCILLRCYISPKNRDRRRSEYYKLRGFDFYLCSVILELSPNLEKDKDPAGSRELNIAVVSMEKYLVPRHLGIKDALLM